MGSQPWAWATASVTLPYHESAMGIRAKGRIRAPLAIDRERSGTTRCGSISRRMPSPVQVGQAPCGELKLKLRGSRSSIWVPSYGHV